MTNHSFNNLLVLLTGPVGGGKTTCSKALAEAFRASDRAAAAVDLDVLYSMARQSPGFADERTWRTARESAGALAQRFFDNGLEVVVIEGSFHDDAECDDVHRFASRERIELVAIDVSYEETARRVAEDPAEDRVATRDPRVLQWLHEQFRDALPYIERNGVVIPADSLRPNEVADAIIEALRDSNRTI